MGGRLSVLLLTDAQEAELLEGLRSIRQALLDLNAGLLEAAGATAETAQHVEGVIVALQL